MIEIKEVHFNHDTNSLSCDALNVCQNKTGHVIKAPEWQDGQTSQPVAFARDAISAEVRIKAKFSGGFRSSALPIRAVSLSKQPGEPGERSLWSRAIFGRSSKLVSDGLLGVSKESYVRFNRVGDSELEEFSFVDHVLSRAAVGIYQLIMIWQYKKGSRWVDFATTDHKVYLVLDIPNKPWTQDVSKETMCNTQLPWADALEIACTYACGATDKDTAARMITQSVNTHPLLFYTPATMFGNCGDDSDHYLLSSFFLYLTMGARFPLNCLDCADAVATLANLLGCDLFEGRINMLEHRVISSLDTKRILTIGSDPQEIANWTNCSWGFHEVAWLEDIQFYCLIYDACLQLDMNDEQANTYPIPRLPIGMQFGSNDPEGYIYRLLQFNAYGLDGCRRRRYVE
jgi:hypothetical protein